MTPLREYSKEEFRDIARHLRPDWTDEEFEEAWEGFLDLKRRKALH